MALKIGIIGLPNVEKSTVLKTPHRLDVPARITPSAPSNQTRAWFLIPDERLLAVAKVSQPEILTGANN